MEDIQLYQVKLGKATPEILLVDCAKIIIKLNIGEAMCTRFECDKVKKIRIEYHYLSLQVIFHVNDAISKYYFNNYHLNKIVVGTY